MAVQAGEIVIDLSLEDNKFKVGVKNSGQLLQQFSRDINTTASSVKKLEASQNSITRKFRDLVLIAGNARFALMDINDIFLRLPASILKTAGELERMQALMTGLSKETTKAAREMEGMRSFNFIANMAKNAPFELKSLSDSFVKFKSAGLDPTNGSLQALVDGVARFGGTGETLKRASVAIQQMTGKGVVSMEELRQQLGEAVPTAMKDMADQMGVTMAELAKMVESGTLKAGPAIAKMLLRMQVNNQGAAEEMMKTWTGMTARLQTQWDLTTKLIADSGFQEEVKRVVDQLTKILESKEGREAAIGFGQALASSVTTLTTFAKAIYEHAELIKNAALAWGAYKLVTGFFAPMAQAIIGTYGKINAAAQQSAQQARTKVAADRAAALEFARIKNDEANAAVAASRRVIEAKAVEMVQLDRANAEILAKQQRLNAALATAASPKSDVRVPFGTGVPGLAGIQSQQAVRAEYAKLTAEMEKNRVKGQQLVADMVALNASHRSLAATAGTTGAALTAVATKSNVLGTAVRAAAGAIGGTLRFALLAMGGWVGVAITAVAALIGYMYSLKNASNEAAAAVQRAKADRSTQDDVNAALETEIELQGKLKSARENVRTLKENVERGGPAGIVADNKKRLDAAMKNEADLANQADAARKELAKRRESVSRQRSSEEAESIVTGVMNVTKAATAANAEQISRAQAENAKRLAGLKEGSDAWKKERQKISNEEADLLIGQKKAQLGALQAEQSKIQEQLDGMRGIPSGNAMLEEQRSALRQAHARIGAEIEEASRTIGAAVDARNVAIEGGTKEKKGDKGGVERLLTPIEKLLASLKASRAELDSEVSTFSESYVKADKALAAAEAIRGKAKAVDKDGNGGFDYRQGKKTVRVDPKQVEEAAQLAAANARIKEAMKTAQDIAETSRGLENDYADAVRTLADPLSLLPDRGKAGQFDDVLKRSGTTILELGQALGHTGTELDKFVASFSKMREQAATIDLAKNVKDVAESTRDMAAETAIINADLIRDDAQRALAMARIDDELFRKKMQNQIDLLKGHEGTNAQILAAEEALAQNMAARAARTREAMKTPMERLLDDWRDTTKQMNNATADWAQQGADAFVNFVKTGKFEWQSLVTDILAGLLKIKLQKELANALDSGGSGNGFLGSIVKGVMGFFTGGSGVGTMGSAAAVGSSMNFAKGGIMTPWGSASLKQYAAGGIANSPQIAIFGEGDMSEAYVPLPDGRSIPVTLATDNTKAGQGAAGAAANVTVNVINQTSQPVTATQGQPRFDGRQMILDVVLAAATQPGPFRDSMKGAMGA